MAMDGALKCPELAVHQIRAGFAHAMTVTADPSPDLYLEAQRDAIKLKRGMWAGGVPKYVLTSLHSVDEKPNSGLVPTTDWYPLHDGHRSVGFIVRPMANAPMSALMKSKSTARPCDRRKPNWTPTITGGLARLTARKQVEVFEIWLMVRTVSAHIPKPERDVMAAALTELVSSVACSWRQTFDPAVA